jgi:glutathione peroxidase
MREERPVTVLHDFKATTIDGSEVSLAQYAGDVVLVVNTASACGYTPQFAGLEQLYETYRAQGLTVLGFPCNQFGGQDPGSDEEIGAFCQKNYGVTFPMFSKVDVNGDLEHPLFTWLKSEKGGLLGKNIKWNFTKFLVGRDGVVIERYAPGTEPADLAADIEKALAG